MTFCTLVEFEWDETFGRESFTSAVGEVGGDTPEGLLSRIVGTDDKGARVIEVWRSAMTRRHSRKKAGHSSPPPRCRHRRG